MHRRLKKRRRRRKEDREVPHYKGRKEGKEEWEERRKRDA